MDKYIKKESINENLVKVTMIVTKGKLISLLHSLDSYNSTLAQDLKNLIAKSLSEANIKDVY